MAIRECDCKEFQDSGHTDECNAHYNPAKEILPCREYFQELKDNILTMFPEKTETQIAVYESWFNEGIRAAHEWHPIETAPKYKILLLYALTDTETGNWAMGTGNYGDDGIWTWDGRRLDKEYYLKPSHWMALPNPPKIEQSK